MRSSTSGSIEMYFPVCRFEGKQSHARKIDNAMFLREEEWKFDE